MVGSHTSNRASGTNRYWYALLAILAVVASACSGGEVNTAAPAMERSAEEQLADLAAAPAASESESADDSSSAPVDEAVAGGDAAGETQPADEPAAADPSAAVDELAAPMSTGGSTAAVLAFAIENSETISYTFEQGMSMEMSFFGIEMNAVPTEAFITGAVDGDANYVRIDMGIFMEAMLGGFEGFGEAAPADELGSIDLSSMVMESWTDGSQQVIDMSAFVASLSAMDPAAATELAPFADGPIAIDASAVAEAQGIDPGELLAQFETGAQYTDPAQLFEALRGIDAVSEIGTDTVNGDAVTVYAAAMSLAQYTEAMGVDIASQMGGLGDIGFDPNDPMMADVMSSMDLIPVSVTIMIDENDQVRRLDISIDAAPMFDDLLGSMLGEDASDEDLGALFGDMEISAKIDTWQIFDNYGESVEIVLPPAEDRTEELLALIEAG